ncbi:MAG: Ldh family oxidoreductase, partial [Rhodospirillaceae bacterium]
LMGWPGSRGAVVSTNPIAVAIPAKSHPPLLLDMATATVALGKIMAAKQAGTPIPADWGIDAAGNPTTDAAAVATLTPMAGAKGAGLSLMIECLASLVAGNPVLVPALAGRKGSHMNGVAIALDLAAFGDPSDFATDVDALATAVAAQPVAEGTDRLLVPGERGDAEAVRRRAAGIPVPPGVWKQLVEAAGRLGVTVPETA